MSNFNKQVSHNTTTATTTGPRAKCDQVVFEALCKACEIIVGSRTHLTSSVSSLCKNNNNSTRFNLQIPEVSGVRGILSQYRQQLHVPVRLDVYYQHDDNDNNGAAAATAAAHHAQNGGARAAGAPPPTRELLERWCLEYRPAANSAERFMSAEGIVTNDPMVQLTHVCKRVVLWLRTLYCWTRLLPMAKATKSNCRNIGFSIYVASNNGGGGGTDDVAELVGNQGFSSSHNKNGVVTTPYGELAWQVMYCPPSKLERLLPVKTAAVRIQVPMPHTSSRSRAAVVAHSAPTNTRPPTYTERSRQKQLEAAQQQQQRQQFGKSYDPSKLMRPRSEQQQQNHHHLHPTTIQRRNTSIGQTSNNNSPVPAKSDNPPERVLSGLSLALMMASNDDDNLGESGSNSGGSPIAVAASSPTKEHDDPGVVVVVHDGVDDGDGDDDDDDETQEAKTRRAALHQMPPHLLEQQHSRSPATATATTGEYGYGYNNHIPWQKIHPSNSNPAYVGQRSQNNYSSAGNNNTSSFQLRTQLSSSPASVSSGGPLRSNSQQQQQLTAPLTPNTTGSAAFLGTTPPVVSGGLAHLIPPRSRSDSNASGRSRSDSNASGGKPQQQAAVTPPFQSRPPGFLQEAPSWTPMEQSLAAANDAKTTTALGVQQPKPQTHVASLDSLRSSPFQTPQQQQQQQQQLLSPESRSSMLSSLSFAPGSDAYMSNLNSILGTSGVTDLRGSMWGSNGAGGGSVLPSSLESGGAHLHPFQQEEDFYSEDMPFAVEMPSSSSTASLGFGGSHHKQSSGAASVAKGGGSYLGNSLALTSLAQKCTAPNHRLKLFEKHAGASDSSAILEEQRGPSDEALPLPKDDDDDDLVNSLANQLSEFRAFGASMHVAAGIEPIGVAAVSALQSEKEQLQGSGASSTSTPISLRS